MKNGIILGNDGKGNLLMSNEDGLFESHDNGETWGKWAAEKMEFAPVIHAKWISIDDKYMGFRCSECGEMFWGSRRNFCHNCGAKMDKE